MDSIFERWRKGYGIGKVYEHFNYTIDSVGMGSMKLQQKTEEMKRRKDNLRFNVRKNRRKIIRVQVS